MASSTFVVCVRNAGYEASLDRGKRYLRSDSRRAEFDRAIAAGSRQRAPLFREADGPLAAASECSYNRGVFGSGNSMTWSNRR